MASSKEIPTSTRPLTHHRPSASTGSAASWTNSRHPSHSRTNSHSHTALSGGLNGAHRVSRRKSLTNPTTNVSAVAAALEESGDKVTPLPIAVNSRRGTMSKSAVVRSSMVGSLPSPPASLPTHKFMMGAKPEKQESAIDDDSNDVSADEGGDGAQKSRIRRASDGQPLTKEGKRSNRVELRCDKCGKGYKHGSCLTKHLWEHTPEWSYTSKLLISKHQQVQLLEAASVLVGMNTTKDATNTTTTPPDSARDFASEADSASPAASGYSEQPGGRSSADTTPPPQVEGVSTPSTLAYRTVPSKRLSGGSGYSRSLQSVAANTFLPESVPDGSGFSYSRRDSSDRRPPSSGRSHTSQDDRDLAAAVELLSCSFGSSGGPRDIRLPDDAPPVPPLPAQYLDHAAFAGLNLPPHFPARQMPESFARGDFRRSEDVKMEDSDVSVVDDDDDGRSRVRSEEDEDGIFGRMEE